MRGECPNLWRGSGRQPAASAEKEEAVAGAEDAAAEARPEPRLEKTADQATCQNDHVSADERAVSAADGPEGIAGGNEGCMSAADCIGFADDRFVQHAVSGKHVDV